MSEDLRVRRVVSGLASDSKQDTYVSDEVLSGVDADFGRSVALWRTDGMPTDPEFGDVGNGRSQGVSSKPGSFEWTIADLNAGSSLEVADDDLLELCQILRGDVELDYDGGSVSLTAGDHVVVRGQPHRWRASNGSGARLSSVPFRATRSGKPMTPVGNGSAREVGAEPRRVVLGVGPDGRPAVQSHGPTPMTQGKPGSTFQQEMWQTLVDIPDIASGGNKPADYTEPMPVAHGISWRHLTIPPGILGSGTPQPGAPPTRHGGSVTSVQRPGMHVTDSIDLDLTHSGAIRCTLPDGQSVVMTAGDAIVQRGVWHHWWVEGDEPWVFSVVMIHTPPFAHPRPEL